MADNIRLGDFLHYPPQQARLDMLPSIELMESRCLLYGPQRSGKSTLLFHYAFTLASSGREVVFLCNQAQIHQNPPLLPYNVSEQHAAFSRIKFKYIQDLSCLKSYGACLHLLQGPPAAIIVDDLSTLLANSKLQDKRARDAQVTKALAYLIDGLEQLREHQHVDVMLLVADTCADDGPHNLYLLQRWFPLVLSIAGNGRLFTLSVAPVSKDKEYSQAAAAHHQAMQLERPMSFHSSRQACQEWSSSSSGIAASPTRRAFGCSPVQPAAASMPYNDAGIAAEVVPLIWTTAAPEGEFQGAMDRFCSLTNGKG